MPFINDRIHGSIEISELAQSIIDTPEFQRLRRVCQTGALQWIFPSANHSRFEHSVGVYHLAKTFAKNLIWNLDIPKKERLVELIGIGGLVHDLGHLAFSHLFEKYLKSVGINFHHEELSQKLFKKICKEYNIKLSKKEIELILNIIHPKNTWNKGIIWEKTKIGKWIYQIVSSPVTGVDVDKFDYLIRDSVVCGINISFDFDRIIKMGRIYQDELVFPWKLRFNIFEMYFSRYQLHQRIYHHKTVLSLEILINKIFMELNKIYNFKKMINNLDILQLTDNIIFNYDNKIVRNILYRIETRNFPKKCVKEKATFIIPITNSLCSERENPLTKIKYINNTDKIIYAKIEDYGILASKNFSNTFNYYFTE